MADVKLSQSELAALDLVIKTMQGGAAPGGFFGDIVNAVGHAVQEAAQVAQVAQQVAGFLGGVGGPADPVGQAVRTVISQLPPGTTVDQLVAIRKQATGS